LDTFLLVDGSDTRLHQLHLLFLGGDAIFNSGKDPPALCGLPSRDVGPFS
jgi:hypothetical protein